MVKKWYRTLPLIAFLATISLPELASAKPEWVRLSIVDDTDSMGVSWNTLQGPAEAMVKYGTVSGKLTLTAQGTAKFISSALGSVSEATMAVKPDTTYYYRVGGDQGGWSDEQTFRTKPTPDPDCARFSFVYVGDSRADCLLGPESACDGASPVWPDLAAKANSFNPLFFLHGGDIVHEGKEENQWRHHLSVTTPISSVVPIMYSIGNHDDGPDEGESSNFNKIFQLPRAAKALGGSGTEDYFAFEVGNAIFVNISTSGFNGGAIPFKDQADWLDKVLTQTDKRWKLVYMHHPIYTEVVSYIIGKSHPPNEEQQNEALVAVINKHQVDVVIGSHNHFYERYTASKCSDPSSETPCPTTIDDGTVYLTSGGGGATLLPLPGPNTNERKAVSGRLHFLVFEIVNHQLRMRAIDLQGTTFDELRITRTPVAKGACGGPGPSVDASVVPADSGLPPRPDAGMSQPDVAATVDTRAGQGGPDFGSAAGPAGESGCACAVSGKGRPASWWWIALGLCVLSSCRRKWRRGGH